MKIGELTSQLFDIKEDYINFEFKIRAIEIASLNLNLQNNDCEEHLVRYDELKIIDEYLYKEKELIYFITKFLESYKNLLKSIDFKRKSIIIANSDNRFALYFDCFITQMYLLLESEQRIQLQHYFNKGKEFSFYPNKNEFGLWWEVYMLRNRVVHYTENRYLSKHDECTCYYTFSSRCNVIRIDQNNNIRINSTLLDIYKDDIFKKTIRNAIITKKNPFDMLFPNKSAKGYNKNYPLISYIDKDIWFDYVSSGINLLYEISNFLNSINNMFFTYILDHLIEKENFINYKISIIIDENELTRTIKELYDL